MLLIPLCVGSIRQQECTKKYRDRCEGWKDEIDSDEPLWG